MKYLFILARLLLGLLFVVFGINMWLHFIAVPPPPPGPASDFMGTIYGSGYLDVVKVLEVTGGLLLLSGRWINLALTLLGPVVVNIVLFHVFLVHGAYAMPVLVSVLFLIVLSRQREYLRVIFAAK